MTRNYGVSGMYGGRSIVQHQPVSASNGVASDKRLVLHVGLSKTGTSTLQNTLFARHSEIYYLGKRRRNKLRKGCTSLEIYKFLNPMLFSFRRQLNVEKQKLFLEEQIMSEAGPKRVILASWERLGNVPVRRYATMLERVYSVFGPFRVMITIRNPLTWITSVYLQDLRGHFVKNNRPWMGLSPYIDFDTWIKRKLLRRINSLDEFFAYSTNIRTAIDLLGKQNVGIFVFERMVNDPIQYYSEICDFLGIDTARGLKQTGQNHLNRSITQSQVSHLQRMNQLTIWGKLLLRTKKKNRKYRKSFGVNPDDSAAATVALPSHWEKGVSDATRAGNRWIARNYNLPLGEFGYPI